jgi:Kef-type K+ transport system membrane component KefB
VGAGAPALAMGLGVRESFGVGVAMNARGAVELVVADVALRAGLFEQPSPPPSVVEHMFSAVVVMALLTTLAAPIALKPLLGR